MKLEFPLQIFEKSSDIKFHQNQSIRTRVVQCGGTDGRTGMTRLIAAFRNYANAPKMSHFFLYCCSLCLVMLIPILSKCLN